MKKFIYRRSVLNIGALIWIILGLIFLTEHYEDIDTGQGGGMLTSMIWIAVALIAILLDLLLQYFLKNRKTVNIIEGIIVFAFVLFIKTYLIA